MKVLSSKITVLTSAIGLGVYIPALLVARCLIDQGYSAETEVLEEYYLPSTRASHIRHREAHHMDFGLAKMAHRMTRDLSHHLDDIRINALVKRWVDEGRLYFIVWSGFWLPIMDRLRQLGVPVHVDHCRIDAVPSASFRIHPPPAGLDREIWLWRKSDNRIVHELVDFDGQPKPWGRRDRRVVVHGGGWGIGTYRMAVAPLACHGFAVDLVVHDPGEARDEPSPVHRYMLTPGWEPWSRDRDGCHELPPMVYLKNDVEMPCPAPDKIPFMRTRIDTAMAIVSKPGGCTLIDSLATATPLVLLSAYGDAEEANAMVWLERGFAITFDAWAAQNFSSDVLERLHQNLLICRQTAKSYPDMQRWSCANERDLSG